jgi:3-phenylpropionate/cinnamic acid dioxygenase small subunit
MGLTAQDHEDIRQLVARYNQGIDLGDYDQFVSTFTEDGSFQVLGLADDVPVDGRHQGHDALRDLAAVHYGNFQGRARHWATNLLIEGDGDEATMQCYLNGFRAGQGESAMLASTGIYRDKLRRTADGWRFMERVVTMDPE